MKQLTERELAIFAALQPITERELAALCALQGLELYRMPPEFEADYMVIKWLGPRCPFTLGSYGLGDKKPWRGHYLPKGLSVEEMARWIRIHADNIGDDYGWCSINEHDLKAVPVLLYEHAEDAQPDSVEPLATDSG